MITIDGQQEQPAAGGSPRRAGDQDAGPARRRRDSALHRRRVRLHRPRSQMGRDIPRRTRPRRIGGDHRPGRHPTRPAAVGSGRRARPEHASRARNRLRQRPGRGKPLAAVRVDGARLGVRCLLSFRLFTTKESYGVLNLYGGSAGTLDDDSQAIGEILAQHAAVALAGAAAEDQFHTALASRDIIGQAKGILMQRDGLTGLQAFAALTRASQETNVKLVNVARWLVNEHESKLNGENSNS